MSKGILWLMLVNKAFKRNFRETPLKAARF
jgi:hypothetical protein